MDSAVDLFRKASIKYELVRALIARAKIRFPEEDGAGARVDLDEAWEIAERGLMRLFLADIRLYRARLFHVLTPYPWESPRADLAAAARLIEETGYHRRDEELADAREALEKPAG